MTDRQTDRVRQTDRQTDRQTVRQTDRQRQQNIKSLDREEVFVTCMFHVTCSIFPCLRLTDRFKYRYEC